MENHLQNRLTTTKLVTLSAILLLLVAGLLAACGSRAEEPAVVREQSQLPKSTVIKSSGVSPTREPVSPTPVPDTSKPSTPTGVPTPVEVETAVPTEVAAETNSVVVETPISASQSIANSNGEEGGVEPDPDYERALSAARLNASGWDTDFRLHTVPYSQIKFVIPRDNIPSIDKPKFVAPSEASAWLKDVEPVVALEVNGDARAYPLQILTWHEIVNDDVGDVPVAVTFCPLCNSAIAFDRRLDGELLEFGVSGNLRNSDLIMYDRQTHSWWQQFTGEGIVGKYAGRTLEHLPASIVSFADFAEAYPQGKVLSRDTGYARQYGRNPYAGYDTADGNPFLFRGDLDGRLLPVERVIAVTLGEADVAFPLTILQDEGAINYDLGKRSIVVFHKFGTTSALDASSIAESRDVGAAGVFDPHLDDQKLTFGVIDEKIVDEQTGSTWDILGNAVEGPLAGKSLTPVVHGSHFWFAWAVFKPDTIVYQGKDGA